MIFQAGNVRESLFNLKEKKSEWRVLGLDLDPLYSEEPAYHANH